MTGIDAYPLSWPIGWKKTERYRRSTSKFGSKSFAVVRDVLFDELRRFRAKDIILSTNIPLRKDGIPYAGYRQPDDVGVAVYFQLEKWNGNKMIKTPMVFACDKWAKIEENIYAIYKTIEALRGVERWGSSDLMERSFTGFMALPPAASTIKREWWEVLGVSRFEKSPDFIKERYRELARANHPDNGGSASKMAEINLAYEEALR